MPSLIPIWKRMISKIWRVLPCAEIRLWYNLHEDPISNFYTRLLTDRQTDKCQVKYNLVGESNIEHSYF